MQRGSWMIRIHREKPPLEYSEIVPGNFDNARKRCYEQARRSSWTSSGDNWWVWWSIENLDRKKHVWRTVTQGKSRLRDGAGPEDTPNLYVPGLDTFIRSTQGPNTNLGDGR